MVSLKMGLTSNGRVSTLASLTILTSLIPTVLADGTGLLGAGMWLYKPVCAHTCRYLLRANQLICEGGHGGSAAGGHGAHGASTTDPMCFLHDDAFLRTTALCIEEYCPRMEGDVLLSDIQRWWEGHLATGTLGDWSEAMRPVMSYQEALELAHKDVDDAGEEGIPAFVAADWLNETSSISDDDFIPTYNYHKSFQWGEFDHGSTSLAIAITSIALPILISLFRFLPGYSRLTSRLNAILDQPLIGHRHRVPVRGNLGLMPTRAQSLYIGYMLIINVVLMCLPARTLQPNSRMESHHMQRVGMLGDRAGVLAFCLYIALYLFSARNNILIWVTGWSHGTFLLLHRWVAYICVYQTVMHSILMLAYFVIWADHSAESQLPYWYWGIIATLATCIMWPLSVLPVRQKMYEVFLATHQILAALVLIGGFLHIWYLFEWNWGYEIWIYVPGAIWFLERCLRLFRIASNGKRTAVLTTIDEESDLLRVEIDGLVAEGHVYLYFPTLSWRFWENHPFSVLSTFAGGASRVGNVSTVNEKTASASSLDAEKAPAATTRDLNQASPSSASSDNENEAAVPTTLLTPRATLLIRPQTGTTKALLAKTRAAGGRLSIPVLIESSYHANPSLHKLSHCSTLVGIAGGVGITAIIPIARTFGGLRSRLFWGAKHDDIVRAIQPELQQLSTSVAVETTIGTRLSVTEILREELLRDDEKGDLGVVVCGPGSMADEVRQVVGELVGSGKAKRGVVFVDEAFSW